jgi:hypothetical protein
MQPIVAMVAISTGLQARCCLVLYFRVSVCKMGGYSFVCDVNICVFTSETTYELTGHYQATTQTSQRKLLLLM